jgi:glycosyltransferase involved in cell wall biosynthesis
LHTEGVSVVIPVRNGARWLSDVIEAIVGECSGRPFEVLVIDDGSEDDSCRTAAQFSDRGIRLLPGPGKGAAAAVNAGLRAAKFPFVAQIDQDVVVNRGWLSSLVAVMADEGVAAVQGWYVRDPSAPLPARLMALDLEQRYAAVDDGRTDHVCTGNVLWRRQAVEQVGGLTEALGYGYDNDLSYRLVAAGWRLAICADARSYHRWRDDWAGYLTQQYGFGYGRLDLLSRHPRRLGGDCVSPGAMMAHPILMLAALGFVCAGAASAAVGNRGAGFVWVAVAALLAGSLLFERAIAGWRAYRRSRDRAALMFPLAHLARDLAWVSAMIVWTGRRLTGARGAPRLSMRPRRPDAPGTVSSSTRPSTTAEVVNHAVTDRPEPLGQ